MTESIHFTAEDAISLIQKISKKNLLSDQSFLIKQLWDNPKKSYIAIKEEREKQTGLKFEDKYFDKKGSNLWQELRFLFNNDNIKKDNFQVILEEHPRKHQSAKANTNAGNVNTPSHSERKISFPAYDKNTWVGRQKMIQELKETIHHSSRITILNGITGINKTALAEKIYLELVSEVCCCKLLRVNFDDQGKSDFYSFLSVGERWLQECEILVTTEERKDKNKIQKKLIEYLRNNLCIVIIDSLEWILQGSQESGWAEFKDRSWVSFFKWILCELEFKSRIIITTQHLPEDISSGYYNFWTCKLIRGLEFTEQLELFEKFGISIQKANLDLVKVIGEVYQGHPLALKIIAARISHIYQRNILAYWTEEGTAVEKVKQDLEKRTLEEPWGIHKTNRDLYFQICSQINKTLERLHQYDYYAYLLICLASTYLKPHTREDWLEHLADEDCNEKQQDMAFQNLIEEALIETEVENNITFYRLHNLIRSVALEHFKKLDN